MRIVTTCWPRADRALVVHAPSAVTWNIVCYHYETRSDGNGGSSTVQVTTKTASTSYALAGWRDASHALVPLEDKLSDIKFRKTYEWRDAEADQVQSHVLKPCARACVLHGHADGTQ